MNTLLIHIFFTLTSMIIGYGVFAFFKSKNIYLIFALCICLILSAISGIFLNLSSFSPFHILSIVVLTTIPLGIYRYVFNSNFDFLNRQVWFNFLGLNLAFMGSFYPTRYIGSKFWFILEEIFGFDPQTSIFLFFTTFAFALSIIFYLIFKTIKETTL